MCFSSTHLESTRHKEKCTFLNFFAESALKRVSHSIWKFENLLIQVHSVGIACGVTVAARDMASEQGAVTQATRDLERVVR